MFLHYAITSNISVTETMPSRPFQILDLFSNFLVREQLLATFQKTNTFLVTFGLF